ncbi:Mitochondrial import inner membrane translocase subunit TIM14-1 [Glycine soja]
MWKRYHLFNGISAGLLINLTSCSWNATPFLAGLAVAAAALASKYGIQAWQAFKTQPPKPRLRKFCDGGFQPTMTRREAALILGVRHGNGEERGGVLSPQSPTPTPQHILVPVSDTRRVKICYPSSYPSGVGENATADKVKEAHRRVMVANHLGGSLASKINKAKKVMVGKGKGSGSAF